MLTRQMIDSATNRWIHPGWIWTDSLISRNVLLKWWMWVEWVFWAFSTIATLGCILVRNRDPSWSEAMGVKVTTAHTGGKAHSFHFRLGIGDFSGPDHSIRIYHPLARNWIRVRHHTQIWFQNWEFHNHRYDKPTILAAISLKEQSRW